jgi:tRNA nucleotidyltransferase (CCA-adding enzyme)
MQMYWVGGAVRDRLLGMQPKDIDVVVVGSTAEEMLDNGFRQIGKDFPIFISRLDELHGDKAEYSLARRSRKNGNADFGPEVTLKEDLGKRDLTINAMAIEINGFLNSHTFQLVDPYCGHDDLLNKVLRMVSSEAFYEDPIRVLRVARFAARYPDFRIDPDTMETMWTMVFEGLLDNLVPERVWKELSRGLMEVKPSRMLQVLRQCGALEKILPEVDALYGVPQPEKHHPEVDTGIHIEQVLDYAASQNFDLPVRFACLMHDLGKALSPKDTWPAHHGHEGAGADLVSNVCVRLNVPMTLAKIAIQTTTWHGVIHQSMKVKHTTIVKLLRHCDAFRNPDRFQYVLQACMCDARGRKSDTVSFENVEYPQAMRLSGALWAARQIKGNEIAKQFQDRPEYIAVSMHAARARAIKAFDRQQKGA